MRRLTALLLSLALCLGLLPIDAGAVSFSDVPESYWAYTDIQELYARGLVQSSGGKFRPGESVSIQAFLSMVCRAAGLDDRNLQSGDNWADPAAAYAVYLGWCGEEEISART